MPVANPAGNVNRLQMILKSPANDPSAVLRTGLRAKGVKHDESCWRE